MLDGTLGLGKQRENDRIPALLQLTCSWGEIDIRISGSGKCWKENEAERGTDGSRGVP